MNHLTSLDNKTRKKLLLQMRRDVEFLKENGLMDYSMLLAVEIDPSYEPQ